MAISRYALRDCAKVLCRGRRYTIGETNPSGFGLWENTAILPTATYPGSLEGWYAVVDHFVQLGDRPVASAMPRAHQRRRVS